MSIEPSALEADRAELAKLKNLTSLMHRAQAGDETSVPELRKYLGGDLLEKVGNTARQIEHHIIVRAAGKNLVARECLFKQVAQMRQELAGPTSTPLERLLIDRVVLCWLHLHDGHMRHAQAEFTWTIAQSEYQERSLLRFQKLYLAAVRSLAMVRRLAGRPVPAVQVEIGKVEVNQDKANDTTDTTKLTKTMAPPVRPARPTRRGRSNRLTARMG